MKNLNSEEEVLLSVGNTYGINKCSKKEGNTYGASESSKNEGNSSRFSECWKIMDNFRSLRLGTLCFLGGILLIVLNIKDCFELKNPSYVVVDIYLIIGGFLVIVLESRTMLCSYCSPLSKKRIVYWMRCVTRLWGRGIMYFVLGSICFAQYDASWSELFLGCYLVAISVVCFFVGRRASVKLNVCLEQLKDRNSQTDDDLRKLFNQIDKNSNNTIEISGFDQYLKSLGQEFTTPEFKGAFDYLNSNNSGVITYGEFLRWCKGGTSPFL
eukprot:TRINITY_DN3692_c0_g1_i1.p1 TRINITY_DN3692_c0_g1~~TRINITY_DN3692_c0_g1_i1.p1  ORF type:complete len:269 (-),score=14.88 TRINITY_DN3692_c0_g1_i1:35-841(-)